MNQKTMMNKKILLIIGAAAVLIAAAAILLFTHRGGDIIGVTTYPDKNRVIMNAKADSQFASGEGTLLVGDGEQIHVEYALDGGSFDVLFVAGKDEIYDALQDPNSLETDALPIPEDWQSFEEKMAESPDLLGQGGVEGRGSLDFAAAPGAYTVIFYPHGTVGRATVTAVKG